jgi:RNA 3'-phosphate cyclase
VSDDLLEIDGSQGEGGGQVLRTALALSILTGRPLRLFNLRARRPKPGLMAQHLRSLDAAAAVSHAEVTGAALHSQQITFRPGKLDSGRYKFEIGTAGATGLVLQTIFLPLSLAGAASSVSITGGTHVPWSPCFHYLDLHWLPVLQRCGFDARLKLEAAGYYPQGGGRIDATVRPAGTPQPLDLTWRGALKRVRGVSAVSNLSAEIGERQKRHTLRRLESLSWPAAPDLRIQSIQLPSPGKGTLLLLQAEFEGGACCYFGLGAPGKPAERVADEAVDLLLEFLESGAAIDQYLADQLVVPLALAQGESRLFTSRVTEHLLTVAAIVQAFLPVQVEIEGQAGRPGLVWVRP